MVLLLLLMAIILPPLPVALLCGLSEKFWLSVVLTVLAWFPGLIYAIYVILTEDA